MHAMNDQQKKAIRRAAEILDFDASELEEFCMRGSRWVGSEAQKQDRDEYRKIARQLRAIIE